jgi:hypothetical protein
MQTDFRRPNGLQLGGISAKEPCTAPVPHQLQKQKPLGSAAAGRRRKNKLVSFDGLFPLEIGIPWYNPKWPLARFNGECDDKPVRVYIYGVSHKFSIRNLF